MQRPPTRRAQRGTGSVPLYGEGSLEKVAQDYGMNTNNPETARIAATEMDYVGTTRDGGVHGTQTGCVELNTSDAAANFYMKNAGKISRNAVLMEFQEEFGDNIPPTLQEPFLQATENPNDKNIDLLSDAWVRYLQGS